MNPVALLTLVGSVVLMLGTLILAVFDPSGNFGSSFSYLFFSLLATMVAVYATLLPSSRVDGKVDIFSPMFGLVFVLLIGAALRAPYLLLEKDTSATARYILFGYDIPDAAPSMVWFFLGVSAIVAGFLVPRSRFAIERFTIFRTNQVSEPRLLGATLFFGLIGLVGVGAYIAANGIDLGAGVASASSKKALAFDAGGETVYGAGYQTFIGQFFKYPFILIASLMLLKVIRTNLLWLVVVISLAVMSAAIPVLGNTRSVVIVIGLIILITLKYFRRLSPRLVVIWLGISLTLISILTELRTENQRLTVERDNIVETILASGNGLDSYRSALIMELVPENAPYQYGKTYMGVISLAIPRAVWPTKPNTAVGPWVKAEVFGVPNVRNNGWPPGIVAEGYLNFSYIGVLVMPFLYGMFLRVFYNTARPLLGRSVLGTVVYASSLYPLCFSGLSNNIALGLVAWLYAIVPMIIFAALIWKKPVPVRAGQRPPAAAAATSRSRNYPARHVN